MESLSVTLGARIHAALLRKLEQMGFDAYAKLVANELDDSAASSEVGGGTTPPTGEVKVRIKKGLYTLDMLRMSLCEVRSGVRCGGKEIDDGPLHTFYIHPPTNEEPTVQ